MADERDPVAAGRFRWAVVMAACALTAAMTGHHMRSDRALQDFVSGPLGILLMAALGVLAVAAALRWSGPDRERRCFLWASASGTALIVVELAFADELHWLGGSLMRPPLPVLLLVYGQHVYALVLFPLALYRWLARRRPVLGLLVYLAWVGFFSWATVPFDRHFLANGVLHFGGGYTVREDVLWGALMYLLVLAVYLALLRRVGVSRPG
jgi:hypothetical protein